MKKLLIPAIFAFLAGCFHNPSAANTPGEYYDMFALVWEDYEANYPEFTLKDIDWKELFSHYSPLAEQAESTEELVMDVLLPMLTELKDVHIWFYRPDGTIMSTYLIDIEPNYDQTVLMENYLWPNDFNGYVDNVGYCNPDSLPYLLINIWTITLNLERIRTFLELAADKPAVIIDIRMNSGGNNSLCGEVSGMFTSIACPAYYCRFRNGPGYDNVYYYPVTTYPDNEICYNGTVYLLIGEQSASSSEDFTLHMDNIENVVMIGDTTMGIGCCPNPLGLADGWKVNTIIWSSWTTDYTPVEWNGIPPDIYVEATEEDFAQGIDPVLEYAIYLINSQPE